MGSPPDTPPATPSAIPIGNASVEAIVGAVVVATSVTPAGEATMGVLWMEFVGVVTAGDW